MIGSGNTSHSLSLSQFDPTIGTLESVNINSVVSVNYGFSLTNTNTSPINFSISVGRNDNFQSPVLSSPYSSSITADVGTFFLNPNQTITEAPATVINRYDNAISISSNVADFIGNGTIGFSYSPHTYTNHSGSSSYQYSATANDTIHFSITYSYCNPIVLLPDLINFSAVKENTTSIKLLWTTINEQPERMYEIQKSTDDIHFSATGTISSKIDPDNSGNYLYHYDANQTEKTKLWFRLKITDASGNVKYSTVKMVDMRDDSSAGIYLYPNPSSQFVNIVFNEFKDWEIEILSSNGALIQKNNSANSIRTRINFSKPLAAGVYFVRAVERQTLKSYIIPLMIQ
jgi:hypothetical protein